MNLSFIPYIYWSLFCEYIIYVPIFLMDFIYYYFDPNDVSLTGILRVGGLTVTWSVAVLYYTEFFG